MNELTQDEHKILIDAIHDSATVIHKGQRMNERIQELMIEAGKTIPGDKHIDADFCKKFAELIVRECYEHCKGQVLDKEVADTNELTYNDAVSDCANGLLQHFGVEE
jgi:hypothetical protein